MKKTTTFFLISVVLGALLTLSTFEFGPQLLGTNNNFFNSSTSHPVEVSRDIASIRKTCSSLSQKFFLSEKFVKTQRIIDKIPEFKYLGVKNIYASLLRLKIHFFKKGSHIEQIPLSKLLPIHRIDQDHVQSYGKMLERADNFYKYFYNNDIPQVIDVDLQISLAPSKNHIKAVRTHDDQYIVIDGNGRVFSMQEAIGQYDQAKQTSPLNLDPSIEIEVFDIDYSLIKNLVDKRRVREFPWNSSNNSIKESLTVPNETEQNLNILISEIQHIRQSPGISSFKLNQWGNRLRYLQNILIWRERGLKDVYKAGLEDINIQWMIEKKAPLGFKNPAQWELAKKELREILEKEGIDDGIAYLSGTSTTFYSHNPTKKAGHHFDRDKLILRSDYDVMLHSKTASDIMKQKGKIWKNHENVSKNRWVKSMFPHLAAYEKKWQKILGRTYSVIVHHDEFSNPTEGMGGFLITDNRP